jgi:hypothetical protein
MQRKTMLAWPVVCALTIAACSGSPQTTLSPSAVEPVATFVNPDGSTLKVGKPRDLGPNGGAVDSPRPTLSFTNAIARFQQVGFAYDIEIQDANGGIVYSRVIGEAANSTSHTVEIDLANSATFWWRVRARLGDQVGPFADFATFRTPAASAPTPGPGGPGLPFPIPAECGPFGPDNRFACAAAVAARSVEWQGCAGGRAISCHRFVRQVVYALAQSDANWKSIVASPGGHACNCGGCGASDGTMFREDTTVYAGSRVFDMIAGAGGPSPSLQWSGVPGPRPGDGPRDAPLCAP